MRSFRRLLHFVALIGLVSCPRPADARGPRCGNIFASAEDRVAQADRTGGLSRFYSTRPNLYRLAQSLAIQAVGTAVFWGVADVIPVVPLYIPRFEYRLPADALERLIARAKNVGFSQAYRELPRRSRAFAQASAFLRAAMVAFNLLTWGYLATELTESVLHRGEAAGRQIEAGLSEAARTYPESVARDLRGQIVDLDGQLAKTADPTSRALIDASLAELRRQAEGVEQR